MISLLLQWNSTRRFSCPISKEERALPSPAVASDFIVEMVLKNEEVLLRRQSNRMLCSNDHRTKVWLSITMKFYEKYEVALSAPHIQQHFNNSEKNYSRRFYGKEVRFTDT